ncbi:unnamed protein product, partial [marine sediment metagenome]
ITAPTDEDKKMSQLLVLSNFGTTLSPFNKFPLDLNQILFDTPAAVETPTFLPAYIGALVDAERNNWEDEILDFFTGSEREVLGDTLRCRGYYILADLHDVNLYLAEKDKDEFQSIFERYADGEWKDDKDDFARLMDLVNTNTGHFSTDKAFPTEENAYSFYLNPSFKGVINDGGKDISGKGSFQELWQGLAARTTVINYSQLTFKMAAASSYEDGYKSLNSLTNI